MSQVNLWLVVRKAGWGSTTLFHRVMETDFAPRDGDTIMLLKSEEEPEGTMSHTVKNAYWDFNGTYNVEMRQFVLDTEVDRVQSGYWSVWWTDRDGDLVTKLKESGWEEPYG